MACDGPSAEAALTKRYKQVVGYVPPMFTDLLHVLSHPDVIEHTREYLNEAEKTIS